MSVKQQIELGLMRPASSRHSYSHVNKWLGPITLKIVNYKKFDAVPQLTGGQKVYTIDEQDNDSICSSLD